eukprot:gene52346-41908_t
MVAPRGGSLAVMIAFYASDDARWHGCGRARTKRLDWVRHTHPEE